MEQNVNAMGTKPVFPLLLTMAFPPMISMLMSSLYNIVDSIFVARLSEDALTAVSLVFPLQNLSLAVAVGLGVGLNSCIARNLGTGNVRAAGEAGAHGFLLSAVHGLLFVLAGLFLSKPFLQMFTDDPKILHMAVQYSVIVITLTFGSHLHIAIEKIFQAVGNMMVPMVLQGVGALINIILDPILIFGLFGFPRLGVIGAAAATVIGQMAACLLAVWQLQRQKKGLKLQLKDFSFRKSLVKNIYQVAIPSTMMTAMPSLLVGVLNGILSRLANASTCIAVLGLYFKMQSFVYMPSNGLVQALRPIVSYNYGAGEHRRLLDTVKAANKVTAVIMIAGTILFAGFPGAIMRLFNAQSALMEMGEQALRILSLGFVISTPSLTFSGAFEALGRGIPSLSISVLRQMSILPLLALILSGFMGATGVWIAFPIAETAAAALAVVLWRKTSGRFTSRRPLSRGTRGR